MGNDLNMQGLPGGYKLPTWGVFPKLNEYIIRGQDLPQELKEFYFGIVELEMQLSNLPVGFVQYVRACVNTVSMIVPFLVKIDGEEKSSVDHLETFFKNEVNEINVECKAMSKAYRGVDGFTMEMISTTIMKQLHDIKQHNVKGSKFGIGGEE